MFDKYLYRNGDDTQTNYDALRYSAITIGTAAIHAIMMIAFLVMRVTPMVIYNIFIVLLYYFLSKNMSDIKLYNKLYFIYLFEVIIHCILATVFVGWDYGFFFYTISWIPVTFYLTFSISSFNRKMFYPIFTTIVVFVSYVIMRIVTWIVDPVYTFDTNGFRYFFYFFNTTIGFLMTLIFSALFSIEITSLRLRLENENHNLEDQANYDPLTHFLNRRSMNERLEQAHRNALINDVHYSLIMCDIDHFKTFNDQNGHDCGDFVLKTISQIIYSQIRAKDCVCRWGGEEFLILISGESTMASEIAERIRRSIEEYEFSYEGKILHVTISMGVSAYYTNSKLSTLIEIADKRLYKGKESGRNIVIS